MDLEGVGVGVGVGGVWPSGHCAGVDSRSVQPQTIPIPEKSIQIKVHALCVTEGTLFGHPCLALCKRTALMFDLAKASVHTSKRDKFS
jgi:hypothetical protein